MQQWVAFSQESTPVPPAWEVNGVTELTSLQWRRVFEELAPFIFHNTPLARSQPVASGEDDVTDDDALYLYEHGTGFYNIPSVPKPATYLNLHGPCLIACQFRTTLPAFLSFKQKGPRGPSEGYFWIKPNTLRDDSGGMYLHALLLWMYEGPPDAPYPTPLETSHDCHHKLCLCPWHMSWVTRQVNTQKTWAHKKRGRG